MVLWRKVVAVCFLAFFSPFVVADGRDGDDDDDGDDGIKETVYLLRVSQKRVCACSSGGGGPVHWMIR